MKKPEHKYIFGYLSENQKLKEITIISNFKKVILYLISLFSIFYIVYKTVFADVSNILEISIPFFLIWICFLIYFFAVYKIIFTSKEVILIYCQRYLVFPLSEYKISYKIFRHHSRTAGSSYYLYFKREDKVKKILIFTDSYTFDNIIKIIENT